MAPTEPDRFYVDGIYVRDRANGDRICGPRTPPKRAPREGEPKFVPPTAEEAQEWAAIANGHNNEARAAALPAKPAKKNEMTGALTINEVRAADAIEKL
jgi:hypothetical protein